MQVAPPLAREEAPVSGGVRWSRTLFVRLKHTWTRLQQEEKAALDDPVGARVRLPACAAGRTHPATPTCLMPFVVQPWGHLKQQSGGGEPLADVTPTSEAHALT